MASAGDFRVQCPTATPDALRAGGGSAFSPSTQKRGHPDRMSSCYTERATRLELASGIPQTASPFAGTLPHLSFYALRAGGGSAFSPSMQKRGHPDRMSSCYMERATRLELAFGIPQTASPFAGTLPHLSFYALRAGGGSAFSPSTQKRGHPDRMSSCYMERATRLELATSTLARWRSTR